MPRPRNEKLKIAERRARVAELYFRGKYQWEIAKAVRTDPATVSRDLKALQAHWLASAVRDLDAAKAAELHRIDHLERTYWTAYDRSLKPKETAHNERTIEEGPPDANGLPTVLGASSKAGKRKEGQAGNMDCLRGVQWCIAKRCEILRLTEAPVAGSTFNTQIHVYSIEQLAALGAEQLEALHRQTLGLPAGLPPPVHEPAEPGPGAGGLPP